MEVARLTLGAPVVGIAVNASSESPGVLARAAPVGIASSVHVPLEVALLAARSVLIALGTSFNEVVTLLDLSSRDGLRIGSRRSLLVVVLSVLSLNKRAIVVRDLALKVLLAGSS